MYHHNQCNAMHTDRQTHAICKSTPNRWCTAELSMPIHEIDRWQIIMGQVNLGMGTKTNKKDEHMFFRKRVQRIYGFIDRPKFTRFVPFSLKGRKMSSSSDKLWIEMREEKKRIFRATAISWWLTRTRMCTLFSFKNTRIFIVVINEAWWAMCVGLCGKIRYFYD